MTEGKDFFTLRSIGEGMRPLIVVHTDEAVYSQFINVLSNEHTSHDIEKHYTGDNAKTIFIRILPYDPLQWELVRDRLLEALKGEKVRQCCMIGFGRTGCAVAQSLYLKERKIIRSLLLVDPSTRESLSAYRRAIDWLENKLPFGLPLRVSDNSFYSMPYLNKFRCPVLIATTSVASNHQLVQATTMASAIPTAWSVNSLEPNSLLELINVLKSIPAKRPMKTV
jgi:pimeloyl-ACP methyl ester carboxylesterase